MSEGLIDEDKYFDMLFEHGYPSKQLDDFLNDSYDINKDRKDLETTKLNYFVVHLPKAKTLDERRHVMLKINKMLDLGASVEAKDSNGLSPILLSVMNGDNEVFLKFMDYVTDLSILYDGVSLFDFAVQYSNDEIVNYLLDYALQKMLDDEESGTAVDILKPRLSTSAEIIRKYFDDVQRQIDEMKGNS